MNQLTNQKNKSEKISIALLTFKSKTNRRNSPPSMALLAAAVLLLSLQLSTFAYSLSAEQNDAIIRLKFNPTIGERHSEEYCAMYDICGERSDGKVLNCPYSSPAVKPDDLFSAKIQSLCPRLSGNVCCTEAQFDTLRQQVQQAIPFLVGCPACLRNFLNLFCELSCSPDQSLFINVTSTAEINGKLTVDGINYFISETFGEELYNSCKDVKFGTMNTRAMEFIGAGAQNFKEWFDFIGQQAELGFPGSPYAINFQLTIPVSSDMELMNVSVYSCGDTSLGCSCGDCPSTLACSDTEPPSPHRSDSCFVSLGSFKVKCIEFALSISYIILILTLVGWALFYGRRERMQAGSTVEPFLNSTLKKDEIRDIPPMGRRIQLSTIQGHMALFFRKYGRWVTRNPTSVLFSSLLVVLIFCLGLIRFKVETRPEMVNLLAFV